MHITKYLYKVKHSKLYSLQGNSAVCFCKQGQGGVIVKLLHPDPRTAHSHELIEMCDREVAACFVFMRFWQLKQHPVSALPTITHRQATINRYISVVLATEAALRLCITHHHAQTGHHQPVHLCQTYKQ